MIKNAFLHLKKIMTHKFWVGYYCFKVGLYKQGLLHDMSKFSPTEFFESIKYYRGTSSPIDACKADKGFSLAWQHHKGRNPHHYEYWTDNYDSGTTRIEMPRKYAVEMICDFLGASRAYTGDKFSYGAVLEWWSRKKQSATMHPNTEALVDNVINGLAKYGDVYFNVLRLIKYEGVDVNFHQF